MDASNLKVAIIGAGNMGGAIARSLAGGGLVPAGNICVSNPTQAKLDSLRAACPGLGVTSGNRQAVSGADVVILAVKPWLVEAVAGEIAPVLASRTLLVSVAAGVSLGMLEGYSKASCRLFRAIPNTAIEVGQGVTAVSAKEYRPGEQELLASLFGQMGKVFFVPEERLDAYMSLASCGIAYAFRYIRAAMEGGVELGIRPQEAEEVVLQTLRGAVELLESKGSHPEAEVDRVTTPGGITIKGLNRMEACGFSHAVVEGLKAGCPR